MWERLKRRSSYQALPNTEPKKIDVYRDLHHPVFQNIRIIQVIMWQLLFQIIWFTKNDYYLKVDEERNIIQTETIITLNEVISPNALQQCLMYIYTGAIDKEYLDLHVSIYFFLKKKILKRDF